MSAGTETRPDGVSLSRARAAGLRALPERAAERLLLAAAARIRIGRLTVVMPDGRRRVFGDRSSSRTAEFRVHDRAAALRLLLHGETGAGEAYVDGQWSSPDLVGLIKLAALNRSGLSLHTGWCRRPCGCAPTCAGSARPSASSSRTP